MRLASILISVLVLALVLSSNAQTTIPKFSVIKETPNKHLSKNNLEIRLEGKVDKASLIKLAYSLRAERKEYERLWIFYYLPETNPRNDAWARSHFTPDGVDVEIIGSTSTEDKQTGNTENIQGEILVKWRSENSQMGATLVMYKTLENSTITRTKFDFETMSCSEEVLEVPKGTLIMQVTHKDGSQSKEVLSVSEANGKKRYDYKNNHGEYYQLEANGNLGLYGQNGKFDEAIKIN